MRLITDFRDYYDEAFPRDQRGRVFRRRMTAERTRFEDFALMRAADMIPPEHGAVEVMAWRFPRPTERFVAYVDDMAHRGEGKILGSADELLAHPEVLHSTPCSRYHPGASRGLSYRLTAIGSALFWYAYRNGGGDWRSNVGNVKILDVDPPRSDEQERAQVSIRRLQVLLDRPLLAVDFVADFDGGLYALDLNTAPGLADTPVERKLNPVEVVGLLSEWTPGGELARYKQTMSDAIHAVQQELAAAIRERDGLRVELATRGHA